MSYSFDSDYLKEQEEKFFISTSRYFFNSSVASFGIQENREGFVSTWEMMLFLSEIRYS